MDIKTVKVEDIIPYARNQKKHDQRQIDNVAESIREFGIVQPVVLDKDNNIIIGHCRILACKQLGIKEVPVVKLEDLTPEEANKLRLLDNKLNESDWDYDILAEDIPTLDFSQFDIDWGLNDEEEEEVEVEEVEVPAAVEPRVKAGQVWLLGDHKLICGDSTDADTINKLTAGEQVDLLLTDPPYNVAYEGKTEEALKIKNDTWKSEEDFKEFLTKAFLIAYNSMKPGAVFYIWHAQMQAHNFIAACKEAALDIKQTLIWNKNYLVLGHSDYQWKHEPCLYGWKEGAAHYFIDDRSQTTVFEDVRPNIHKMKKEELVKLLEDIYSDKISTTIINEDKPQTSYEHPTMKPIKLLARQIKNSTRPGEIVLDLFGGSGSTLIACDQLGRKCLMCELDPHYCDVIITRWEKLTGEEAVLITD